MIDPDRMTNRSDIDRSNERGSLGNGGSVWQVAARSHVGLKRSSNQDRFLIDRHGERFVGVVADGMGGHAGGETASGIALERLAAILDDAPLPSAAEAATLLERGAVEGNEEIRSAGDADPELRGMGTTLVGLVVDDTASGAFLNVGDSRLYRMRGGELSQLSHDHSVVADLVRQGEITPEEAAVHPRRNVLTRALGVERRVEPQVGSLEVEPGDLFLLSSDGLHGMISDRDIARILSADWTLEARCDSLVEAALDAGGADNVTVVLLQRHTGPIGRGIAAAASGGWLLLPLLLLALLVLLRIISTDGSFDGEPRTPYPVDSLMQPIDEAAARGADTIPDSLRGFPFDRNRSLIDSTLQPTPGDIIDNPDLVDTVGRSESGEQ